MPQHESIHDRARGRWRTILPALGVPVEFLTGKHCACPMCGGKDRFRWDNKGGSGGYYCNGCGSGSGVDLVMRIKKMGFLEARVLIEREIGAAPVEVPKAIRRDSSRFSEAWWTSAVRLNGIDPASKYLMRRGIRMAEWPNQIRYLPGASYLHEDGRKTTHPAMLAKFVSPDAQTFSVQATFLDDAGRKAALPKIRKWAPGSIPKGGAVRLMHSAETMGVAEGVETAISAMLLHDVPVWAVLSAGNLTAWEPPPRVKHVLIFADCDASFAGQAAAYGLAHRLSASGRTADVRLPDDIGTDWNDVLLEGKEVVEATM